MEQRTICFSSSNGAIVGRFELMASNCEVHIRTDDDRFGRNLVEAAYGEGKRIERHFSRYRKDNLLFRINSGREAFVELDNEYSQLMDYAFSLFRISDGLFDISSGALRRIWTFNNREQANARSVAERAVMEVLPLIGLNRVDWQRPVLRVPKGMELDFGGIGKEYAVDRTSQLIEKHFNGHYMVNFGGDCYCHGNAHSPWTVGIERSGGAFRNEGEHHGDHVVLAKGGVATSGTTKRYFTDMGERFGHILNPKTGYPIEGAPLSVTVANESCLTAGSMATLAMLQGKFAERFCRNSGLLHWIQR